jgi:tripartite-type tricarboxylate transporter receptor subunit TctC
MGFVLAERRIAPPPVETPAGTSAKLVLKEKRDAAAAPRQIRARKHSMLRSAATRRTAVHEPGRSRATRAITALAAGLLTGLLTSFGTFASAQTSFNGKMIRLYIGTGAGGGYDAFGRLVARHIGRHIPGNPGVVPQNMPGASSLTLTNYLFNSAPRDGTAIGTINEGIPSEQYLDPSITTYDSKKFNWIGRVTSVVELIIVWHTVAVNAIEEVRTRETIMGGTGPTSPTVFIPYLLNNVAGMKFKVITGFTGTTDVGLAMQRGEVEGSWTPLESLTSYRLEWMRERKIKLLMQYNAVRDPEIPDVPAMIELGKTEEERQILGFFASAKDVGRSIVAPPGMPAETVTTLRRAFDEMLTDPLFMDDAKKMGFVLKPMAGERLQELIIELSKFPPALVEKARRAREKPN